MSAAERALRLRAEELITGFSDIGVERAIEALDDLETAAAAVAGSGVLDAELSSSIVADTVDALVVRGASFVEAAALDLDVRRLYDLAAGAPRPRLRRVVPVASGGVTSVDLWEDHAEVRSVGLDGVVQPALHLDAIAEDDRTLELDDGAGGVLSVDLTVGRPAADGGAVRSLDGRAEYLARIFRIAVAAARRDPSVEQLNRQRRRLGVAAEILAAPSLVEQFDVSVAATDERRPAALVGVVPVAVHAPFGWVLSVESWSDHWRAVVRLDAPGMWTAVDGDGTGYGGIALADEVIRFDPPLPPSWSSVTLECLRGDGTSAEVEVRR